MQQVSPMLLRVLIELLKRNKVTEVINALTVELNRLEGE
jgi:hypothetical protein